MDKKYNDALERARKVRAHECESLKNKIDRETLEYIFPELKKPTDNEICEWLIGFIKSKSMYFMDSSIGYDNVISWLENQCAKTNSDLYGHIQKALSGMDELIDTNNIIDNSDICNNNIDILLTVRRELNCAMSTKPGNAYPKFAIDDWIVDNHNATYKIISIDYNNSIYDLQALYGDSHRMLISYVDEYFHLWDITDAKAGDVLSIDDDDCPATFIFSGQFSTETMNVPISLCCIYRGDHTFRAYKNPFWYTGNNIYPAEKTQLDTLFEKMNEEGYEFNDLTNTVQKIS